MHLWESVTWWLASIRPIPKATPSPISRADFEIFGAQRLGGVIPNAVIIMLIVLVVSSIILNQTKLGRYIYGVGDNEEASLMSGVNTRSTIVWAYVFCGIACGVTAVMLTSRLGSAHPQAAEDYLLDAIAAVWLGGTAFKDGEPNLAGTLLGALIIGTMANGLTILNVSYYYQDIATGLIILAAVIIILGSEEPQELTKDWRILV